jgi:hypothetical protein
MGSGRCHAGALAGAALLALVLAASAAAHVAVSCGLA